MAFFYGTLRDETILTLVLGRRLAPSQRRAAILPGFRTVEAPAATYPMVIADPAGQAPGVLVSGLSRQDMARLCHYEGTDYQTESLPVQPRGGRCQEALVFVPAMPPSGGKAWEFETWRCRHRSRYLARLQRVMRAALAN